MTSVGVIGAGAWGTVIANIMADNGHDVTLWCYKNDIAKAIANLQTHHRLPGVNLSEKLKTTTKFSDCYDVDLLVLDYLQAVD